MKAFGAMALNSSMMAKSMKYFHYEISGEITGAGGGGETCAVLVWPNATGISKSHKKNRRTDVMA
jgi:hypothetical protein